MQKKFHSSILTLLLGMIPAANAAEILLIEAATSTELRTFLEDEGHTVTQETRETGPGDVSTFDLIIFGRGTNSGAYIQGTEPNDWNSLTLPIINFNPFLYRASRLGWITTEGTGAGAASDAFELPFPDPSSPFLTGLTAPEDVIFSSNQTSRRPLIASELLTEAEVITTSDGGDRAGIFTLAAGTTMAGTGRGIAGGLRIAWPINDASNWDATNSNAEQILNNIIGVATTPAGDSDFDGMLDDYEVLNGLNPSLNDAALDFDGDNLNNLAEHDGTNNAGVSHGFGQTRANLLDTDGDGANDLVEISGSDNAFQTTVDGDTADSFPGLPTNPNVADSDNDGASDGDEIAALTNPNAADTDGDLMTDGYELDNSLLGGLNPLVDDANNDLDGDNLNNLEEFNGSNSTGNIQTRADMPDTDGDGYSDFAEDNFGAWDSPMLTGTNPTIADTDGDGILDGQENFDLTSFPGLGVFPTNSDPNAADTDGDGLQDGNEANIYGSDPILTDTDGDGTSDPGEVLLYQTNPNSSAEAPSAAQLAELRVNFQTIADAATTTDFQNYTADHEVLSTFTEQLFSAFGGTDNITVGLSWDDGNGAGVDPQAPQMLSRAQDTGEFATEWPQILLDWAGTDARVTPSEPFTITISGLPAGNYLWTSVHSDQQDQTSAFNASITSASGQSAVALVNPLSGNEGANEWSEAVTYEQIFSSNGVDDITAEFDSTGPFFMINAFMISNTNLPASNDIMITAQSFDAATGDFLVSFSPAGTNFILTSSDDLVVPFVEETSATLENSNSTFRIPASSLNTGKDFFRVEEAP